jgi:ABC-type multidrug transport system ATPase subunit
MEIEQGNGSGKTTLIRLLSRLIEPSTEPSLSHNTNYKAI